MSNMFKLNLTIGKWKYSYTITDKPEYGAFVDKYESAYNQY